MVLTENLDHNLPDRTKQTCPLLCPCVYLRGWQVLWLPKCLSVLNTGLDRGKSKNKLAIWEGGQFLRSGEECALSLLSRAYFRLSTASKVTNGEGHPPPVSQRYRSSRSFLSGKQKGNLLAFGASHRDERGIKWYHPCGIAKAKTGRFIWALRGSLRLEGLDWNPYNTFIH